MNQDNQEELKRLNEEKKLEDQTIQQGININEAKKEEVKKEEEKKEEEKKEDNNKDIKVENNPLKPSVIAEKDSKLQAQFQNIFQTDLSFDSETNNSRRKIMHISVFAIMIELVILQILWYHFYKKSLFLNVCYGEIIEMEYWISQSIVPLTLLSILCNIGIYLGSDIVALKFSTIIVIVDFLLSFIYLCFSIYCMIVSSSSSQTSTTILYNWSILSPQTQLYYYNNSITTLASTYYSKMIITGLLYLLIVFINAFVLVYSLKLFCNLEETWRPSLRSKFSDTRATRYIEMYKKLNAAKLSDSDKPLLKKVDERANNQNAFKQDVNKILEEVKERNVPEDKNVNFQEDEQNKKSKRALPKKKKTERDYEKVDQKEE